MGQPSVEQGPVFLFDGDCGFCRRYAERLRVITRGSVTVLPSQEAASRLQIPEAEWRLAAQFVDGDGERTQGAEAIFQAHAASGRKGALWAYEHLLGWGLLCRAAYWVIARARPVVSLLTTALVDRDLREDPWTLTRSVYLKALGLVMLLAVLSYWSQIQALNGAEGILPAAEYAERVAKAAESRGWSGWETVQAMPSLYALSPSDTTLHGLCALAALGALLLMLGILPGPALLALLAAWSSIVAVGGIFTGYQWDIFNIEVCFASLFVAPWALWPRCTRGRRATVAGKWLLRVVLFKFMLLQGLVKYLSGDAPWEELTALQYHFWTQPIPHVASWYAHHLPAWLLEASVVAMFVVELVLPFFIFGTRRMRQIAAFGFITLMLGIVATGNYGTFNLLTIALSITLLDDGALRRLVPASWRDTVLDTRAERHAPSHLALRLPRAGLVGLLVVLNLWMVGQRAGAEMPESAFIEGLAQDTRKLRICTTYGAFSNMTEDRPEILIEGSRDGKTWTPYRLRYKTLALDQHHGFAASHMPRLDWQLWFAALRGQCQKTRWFLPFAKRLLEGQPDVLGLLEHNPFGEAPPRFLRSSLWAYTFTTPAERDLSGNIWKRERLRDYCPKLTLKDGALSNAERP